MIPSKSRCCLTGCPLRGVQSTYMLKPFTGKNRLKSHPQRYFNGIFSSKSILAILLQWQLGLMGPCGAIKYFIITGVGYSSPNTTLTLYGGTDYDLANSAIIEPYFSMAKAPYGFPLDEAKWRVESLVTADSSQASPVAGTWYNKGGSLAVPIGRWRVEYAAELEVTRAAAGALDVFATLSTAASSEVNKETTTKIGISSGISMRRSVSHCGYLLDLAAKATYYLNCKTGQASMTAIAFKGSEQKTKVRAVCAYL